MGEFSFAVLSDPQYPRSYDESSGQESAYGNRGRSESASRNTVSAVKSCNPSFTIINGDLTEFGHDDELDKYKEIFGSLPNKYIGLGNHDYLNNVWDCDGNNCFANMVNYLESEVSGYQVNAFDYSHRHETKVVGHVVFDNNYHSGSHAYEFDRDGVRFIQLNEDPTHAVKTHSTGSIGTSTTDHYDMNSPLDWLKGRLSKAKNDGMPVILNLHDPCEHWSAPAGFKDLMEKGVVRAVFVAHYHGKLGRCLDYVDRFGDVPVFHSGAVLRETFLMARTAIQGVKRPEEYVYLGKSPNQYLSIDSSGDVSHPSEGMRFKATGFPKGNLFDLQAPDGKYLCWHHEKKPFSFYLDTAPNCAFKKRKDGALTNDLTDIAFLEDGGKLVPDLSEVTGIKNSPAHVKVYSPSGGDWEPPPAFQETQLFLHVSQYSSKGGQAKLLKDETPVRIR